MILHWGQDRERNRNIITVKLTRAFVSPSITGIEHWKSPSSWEVWQLQADLWQFHGGHLSTSLCEGLCLHFSLREMVWWCPRPWNLFIPRSIHTQLKVHFLFLRSLLSTFIGEPSSVPTSYNALIMPLNFTALVKPKSKAFIFTARLRLLPFDLLFVLCVTRTEYQNSLLSFPPSVCLSCSQITFGFCSAVTPRIPGINPSLRPFQRNQDQAGTRLQGTLKEHLVFKGCKGIPWVFQLQNWKFSLLLLLLLLLYFLLLCVILPVYFCRILLQHLQFLQSALKYIWTS